jgi:hypothetical protein
LIVLVNFGYGSLCADLAQGLAERGFAVRHLPGLYDREAEVSFKLDTNRSSSSYRLGTDTSICDSEISGALVLRNPFIRENLGGVIPT